MDYLRNVGLAGLVLMLSACDGLSGCEAYASEYSCGYVEDRATYEVWYWKNVEDDNEDDNLYIGEAVGLRMCEKNARAFAAAIDKPFVWRAYICVLMIDGQRVEKHRFLSAD